MKKVLSLLLVICMVISATPIFTSAITYEQFDTVFDGFATMGFELSATASLTLSTQKIGSYPYYHYTAKAGDYNNISHIISLKPKNMVPDDYPIVKVYYRTNSPATNLDVSILSPKGENWMKSHPTLNADGEWNTLTFNYNDITGAGSNPKLTIAPLGSGSKTLISARNFDIEYIGMFKTRAGAANFEYKGENGDNMTSSAVIYTAQLLDPARVPTGTKIFVAANGSSSSSNNGTDPSNPVNYSRFVTINKSLAQGSTVFFKRGDTFRITDAMQARNYITYTSYGFGDKPKLVASIDGTGASKWSKTAYENVWVFNQTLSGLSNDVGHIRINDGELWGIKVSAKNYTDERVNNGNVFNGRTFIEGCTGTLENGKGLVNDLEFWHDYDNGKLYFYCPDGNPGSVFDSIEIANKGHAIQGYTGTTIDNLYITGAGSHGVSMGTVQDIMISNLFLEWIGGSIQTLALSGSATEGGTPVRFGNALEAYGGAVNLTMKNNFCDQIYDCCYTVQNQGAVTFDNVFMYDNVARYSNSGLEVWQSGGITNNMHLYDNYTLFGGYGWSHQRPNKDGNFFYGGTGIRATTFTNNSVDNNVNILASSIANLVSELGSVRYNFNHNVYIMGENKTYTQAPTNTEGYGAVSKIPYNYTSIQSAVSRGTDEGSTFYFIPTNAFNIGDDPYEVFKISDNPVYDITLDVSSLALGISQQYKLNATVLPADADNNEVYFSSENPLIASVNEEGVITANYADTTTVKAISKDSGVWVGVEVTVISTGYAPDIWSKDTPGKEDETIKLLLMGDKLFGGDYTFASKLEEGYYVNATSVIENSMTAASAINNMPTDKSNYDLVLLSLGYNDYLNATPIDEFKSSLNEFFLKMHTYQPLAYIAYITPYNITSDQNSLGLTLGDYVSAACEAAKMSVVKVADIYKNAETKFALFDKNGNAGQILTEYIDSALTLTSLGADCFAADAIALLDRAEAINLYGVYGDLEYAYYYTAEMMKDISVSQNGHFTTPTLVTDSDTTYLRFTAQNSVTSGDGVGIDFVVSGANILAKEYPYVQIAYRAHIQNIRTIDLNFGIDKFHASGDTSSTVGVRLWGLRPAYVNDQFTTLYFDASKATGGEHVGSPYSWSNVADDGIYTYLRLKLWGGQGGAATTAGDTFEVQYIAFFTDEATMNSFVYDTDLRGLTVPEKLSVVKGTTTKLDVDLEPSSAYAKLVYSSDNETVARVTADGKIVGLKAGTANITVATHNNKYSDVCAVTVTNPEKDYSKYIIDRDNLENLVYRINNDKELNVVYLGGSVTAGAGAQTPGACWRELIGTWLTDMFPDATINNYNSAMGGSGSMLGAFRTEADVLAHDPDLVFVEFAVNDSYSGHYSDGTVQFYYESILRQIREKSPETEIISIYVTDQGRLGETSMGTIPSLQDAVAAHYGVTSIDVGRAMSDHIVATGATWKDYVSDSVHPADAGYAIYGDAIKQYLFAELFEAGYAPTALTQHTVPETYVDARNETFVPEYVEVSEDIFDSITGWTYSSNRVYSNLDTDGYIYPSANVNSFTYTFKGTGIAFYMEFNGGKYYVKWSIDGGETKSLYVNDTNHPFNKMFKTGSLEDKEHTITFSYKGTDGTGGTNSGLKLTRLLVSKTAFEEEEEPDVLCGDVDGNGKVEPADGVALSRYNAQWAGYSESEIAIENADVDGVEGVGSNDAVALARYLAQWAGYEALPLVPAE